MAMAPDAFFLAEMSAAASRTSLAFLRCQGPPVHGHIVRALMFSWAVVCLGEAWRY